MVDTGVWLLAVVSWQDEVWSLVHEAVSWLVAEWWLVEEVASVVRNQLDKDDEQLLGR